VLLFDWIHHVGSAFIYYHCRGPWPAHREVTPAGRARVAAAGRTA